MDREVASPQDYEAYYEVAYRSALGSRTVVQAALLRCASSQPTFCVLCKVGRKNDKTQNCSVGVCAFQGCELLVAMARHLNPLTFLWMQGRQDDVRARQALPRVLETSSTILINT